MTAVAGFHFNAVFFGVLASLTTVFFYLNFSRNRAVAHIVRALNRLLHERTIPR
jgi:hypothetical protein